MRLRLLRKGRGRMRIVDATPGTYLGAKHGRISNISRSSSKDARTARAVDASVDGNSSFIESATPSLLARIEALRETSSDGNWTISDVLALLAAVMTCWLGAASREKELRRLARQVAVRSLRGVMKSALRTWVSLTSRTAHRIFMWMKVGFVGGLYYKNLLGVCVCVCVCMCVYGCECVCEREKESLCVIYLLCSYSDLRWRESCNWSFTFQIVVGAAFVISFH